MRPSGPHADAPQWGAARPRLGYRSQRNAGERSAVRWRPTAPRLDRALITRNSSRIGLSASADVVGQVLDLEALLLRLELDNVTHREHTHDLAAVDDRDVADSLVGHQGHALV